MKTTPIIYSAKKPIENVILTVRGQRVILDADLAKVYGVSTKRLNEQVQRNRERFPAHFMFQLTEAEKAEVVANCDHLRKLKFSPVLPYAFTEHGAIMSPAGVRSATPACQTRAWQNTPARLWYER